MRSSEHSPPLSLAIVGAGAMGSLHARVVSECPEADLRVVVDCDPARARRLADAAGAAASDALDAALACDAAIVATPAIRHREVALPLLDAGIPVLVEKPLTPGIGDTAGLIEIARRRAVPLTCGFVERFNPVVIALRRRLADIGPLRHLMAIRHSPPNRRASLDVVHDLLIHDIDLALLLSGASVASIGAAGWRDAETGRMEISDCVMTFDDGAVASLSASRAGQRKVRELRVAAEGALIELDLLRRTITEYRHVAHGDGSHPGGYRAETVVDIPFVRQEGEPLSLQLRHFLGLARGEIDAAQELSTLLAPHQAGDVVARVAVSGPTRSARPPRSSPDRGAPVPDAPGAPVPVG